MQTGLLIMDFSSIVTTFPDHVLCGWTKNTDTLCAIIQTKLLANV